MDDNNLLRYSRHLILPDFSENAQKKLSLSKVLLIGAGGLGNLLAMQLAASGVGVLRVVDDDLIEIENLPRQLVYRYTDVGQSKAKVLAQACRNNNPECQAEGLPVRFCQANALELVQGIDLVIDLTDNWETRYLVNHTCVHNNSKLLSVSVIGWSGQMMLLDPGRKSRPCYNCVFPASADEPMEAQSCAESGVFAPAVHMLCSFASSHALLYLANLSTDLTNTLFDKLLICEAKDTSVRKISLHADSECFCQYPSV